MWLYYIRLLIFNKLSKDPRKNLNFFNLLFLHSLRIFLKWIIAEVQINTYDVVYSESAKGRGDRGTGPGRLFTGAPKRLSMCMKFLFFNDNELFLTISNGNNFFRLPRAPKCLALAPTIGQTCYKPMVKNPVHFYVRSRNYILSVINSNQINITTVI